MTFTATDIYDRAALILQDAGHVRWPIATVLRVWLNDGLRTIAIAKPTATSERVDFALQPGSRQELTNPEHLQVIEVQRNVEGAPITAVSRHLLDAALGNWQDPTVLDAHDQADHVIYDETEPDVFYVVPGNDGTGRIEIIVSTLPDKVTAATEADEDAVDIADEYLEPLVQFVVAKCYSMDTAIAGSAARAQTAMAAFSAAIGMQAEAEKTNPNTLAE